MNQSVYSSSHFSWSNEGKLGTTSVSRLFGQPYFSPEAIFGVQSARTGVIKSFELDVNAPGYEDGWDGEYKRYISTDGNVRLHIDLS